MDKAGTRAATIVIGILIGVLANLATSGFDFTRWRWWLIGSIVVGGVVWAILEYRQESPAPERSAEPSTTRWLLPAVENLVERPHLSAELSALLTRPSAGVVGVTTALYGAGGFGKTTLVVQVCSMPEVRASYPGGLSWVTIGAEKSGADIAAILNDMAAQLVGERPQFIDPEQAGRYYGSLLDSRPRNLLVIDDVWTSEQLRPFLLGGHRTTRIVTTRNQNVLPASTRSIKIDEMAPAESSRLLSRQLSTLPAQSQEKLLRQTGNWPLLLAIVNGAIQKHVRDGHTPSSAADILIEQLEQEGPAALDVRVPASRDQAVGLTVSASVRLLNPLDRERYYQLGIFAEDAEVPLTALSVLWGVPATDTRMLCQDLGSLSLVKSYRRGSATLQLHDVIRNHLRHQIEPNLPGINRGFLAAVKRNLSIEGEEWWLLPKSATYLWRNLTYHLQETGMTAEMGNLICDLRWAEERINDFGLPAYESDLARVAGPLSAILRRTLARKGHLLGPIVPAHSHADILVSRLEEYPELAAIVTKYRASLSSGEARLLATWPIPPVDPALQRVLDDHANAVTDCSISPDGRLLATSSADRTVRIWDTSTWSEAALLHGHEDVVGACAFSADGLLLASGGDDAQVHIWRTVDWGLQATLTGHRGAITACEFAGTGGWLVTTSADRTIRIWSSTDWSPVKELTGHAGAVTDAAVSPDGLLATAGADRTVRIWASQDWSLVQVIGEHQGPVTSVAFSADGHRLVTTSLDNTAKVWSTDTWALIHVLGGHAKGILDCAVSPDGKWVATAGEDRTIQLWDLRTGRPGALLRGHTEAIFTTAIAAKSGWMASGSADHHTRIWEIQGSRDRGTSFEQNRAVTSCAVSSSGDWVIAVGGDDRAYIWDHGAPKVRSTLMGHTGLTTACAISNNGRHVAVAGQDRTIRVYSAHDWTAVAVLTLAESFAQDIAFSPDGYYLVGITSGGAVQIWETDPWQAVNTRSIGHEGVSCAFSRDGARLAVGDRHGLVQIWDTEDWSQIGRLTAHVGATTCLAFSRDGRWLISGGEDGALRVWDSQLWICTAEMVNHHGSLTDCMVSPSGSWLASTGTDMTLRIWEIPTWAPTAAMRTNGRASAVAWAPDDQTLSVGGVGGLYQFRYQPPS